MKIWKKLIVPGIALLIVIVGVIIVKLLPDDTEATATTVAETTIPESESANLPSLSASDIKKLSVTEQGGTSYSLIKSADSTEEEILWEVDAEYAEDYEMDQNALSSVISALGMYSPTQHYTEGMNRLADYGLDNPVYTVEITTMSGEIQNVYFGNLVSGETNVYCISDKSNAVGVVVKSKIDNCQKTLLDFISKDIVSLTPEDVDYFEIDRKEDSFSIEAQLLPQSQKTAEAEAQTAEAMGQTIAQDEVRYESLLTVPLEIKGSDYDLGMTLFLQTMLNLPASSFIDLAPDDLSKYFLDKPAYSIVYHTKENGEIRIDLSANTGGRHFAISSKFPAVFTIETASMPGLQTPFIRLIDTQTAFQNISDVSKVECEFPEGSFVFELDVPKTGGAADEEAILSLNGIDAKIMKDSRSTYATQLYTKSALFVIESFDSVGRPTDDPEIKVKITMKDGNIKEVEFYKRDTKTYFMSFDGKFQGLVISAEKLYGKKNPENFDTYGLWDMYQFMLEAIENAVDGVYPMPTKSAG